MAVDRKAEIAAIKEKRKLIKDTLKLQQDITGEMVREAETAEGTDKILNKIFGTRAKASQLEKEMNDALASGNKDRIQQVNLSAQGAKASMAQMQSLKSSLGPISGLVKGAKAFQLAMLANPMLALVTGAIALYQAISKGAKAVREFQRQTGLSAMEAAKLELNFKKIALLNIDLEADNLRAAFVAARTELGASVDEAVALSDNIARGAAQTGQTEDQFVKVLSAMETVSDMSREQLINQMKTNALLIEAEGLAPTDVFADMASDTELMAKFTKDSGKNFQDAAIKAKKLGMSVATTAKSANSLLDFESSIEKQMEASLLLGRQINLDKARQLAFDDDLSGLQDEILKQVGGQAEFAGLRSVQKQALADAVGVDIAELSKLVKGNDAAAGEGSVATAGNEAEQLKGIHGQMVEANNTRVTMQGMKDLFADEG